MIHASCAPTPAASVQMQIRRKRKPKWRLIFFLVAKLLFLRLPNAAACDAPASSTCDIKLDKTEGRADIAKSLLRLAFRQMTIDHWHPAIRSGKGRALSYTSAGDYFQWTERSEPRDFRWLFRHLDSGRSRRIWYLIGCPELTHPGTVSLRQNHLSTDQKAALSVDSENWPS